MTKLEMLGESPARPERSPGAHSNGTVAGYRMIIQDQGNQLVVIRQTDHAVLAGFFARELGNDFYPPPEPKESFCLAVAEHDNGWSEWELLPQIDPASFLPYSFMSVSTEEHIALYQRGIERVVKVDRYAGLLVSMHCAELYDRTRATMPGYSAKYVKSNESQAVNEFLQRLKLQQLRLKVDVRADAAMKDFADDKLLDANFRRLEALDRLSLYFCLPPYEGMAIESVPAGDAGREVDWEIRPQGNNVITLAPFPFRRDPLEISILARRVPKRRYADDLDFQKTLAGAPYFAMNFTLRAGDARLRIVAARA